MTAPIPFNPKLLQTHPHGPKSASRSVVVLAPNKRGTYTVLVEDEHGRWHRDYATQLWAIREGLEQVCKSVQYELRRKKFARNPMVNSDVSRVPDLPVALTLLVTATYHAFDLDLFVEIAHDPSRWSRDGRHVAELATDIVNRLESHPLRLDEPFGTQAWRALPPPDPLDVIPESLEAPEEMEVDCVPTGLLHQLTSGALTEPVTERSDAGDLQAGNGISIEPDFIRLTDPEPDPPRPTPLVPTPGFPEMIDSLISGSEDRLRHLLETEADLRRQIKDARNERSSLEAARDAYLKRRIAS